MTVSTKNKPSLDAPYDPDRVVVGSDYFFDRGIRSRTQFNRLRQAGRISPFFYIGSRLRQYKDVADADLARLRQPQKSNKSGGGEAA